MSVLWQAVWWWWLVAVGVSFALLEGLAILLAGGKSAYTLSDTIRRWTAAWHPLAAIVTTAMLVLAAHWFLMPNPGGMP